MALKGVVSDMISLIKTRPGCFVSFIAELKASHKEKRSQIQGRLVKVREKKEAAVQETRVKKRKTVKVQKKRR